MNKQSVFSVAVCCVLLAPMVALLAGERPSAPGVDTLWPTKGWATARPASVGLDEKVLDALEKELAAGKFSLRGKSLRPHVSARLREDLWEAGEGERPAERAAHGPL